MAKPATPINETVLRQSIAKADDEGHKNLNALWKRAADLYNSSDNIPKEISFSVVMLRAQAWSLLETLKTKPGRRGRQASTSQEAPSSPKPQAVAAEPTPTIAQRPRFSSGIRAPAGEPYARLTATDSTSVAKWARQIREEAERRGLIFKPEAYDYWLRMYFFSPLDNKEKYQTARENLFQTVGYPES